MKAFDRPEQIGRVKNVSWYVPCVQVCTVLDTDMLCQTVNTHKSLLRRINWRIQQGSISSELLVINTDLHSAFYEYAFYVQYTEKVLQPCHWKFDLHSITLFSLLSCDEKQKSRKPIFLCRTRAVGGVQMDSGCTKH